MTRSARPRAAAATTSRDAREVVEEVDVAVIGAGLSGIGVARELRSEHPDLRLAILEARDSLGGTWDLFRYPGVRSDSDMYTLGYASRPWTGRRAIAPGEEILEYLRSAAVEGGIDGEIRYRTRVEAASWSSEERRWTLRLLRDGEHVLLRCRFLVSCTGYYRYDRGHTIDLPGAQDFAGALVHPQHWPDGLDVAGRRVVVIGSGATAVTLVPALARDAAHVTMLQRSPGYISSLPAEDLLAVRLRRWLGAERAHAIVRRRNVALSTAIYRLCRRYPGAMRRFLQSGVRRALPSGFDVATHFTPSYEPWDQRLCLVPDGDLFETLRRRHASVVTGTVERLTSDGVVLASGEVLPADVVVTATGLELLCFGGIAFDVDGAPLDPAEQVAFRSTLLSDFPNFAFVIGYTNASWTLKVDLVAGYLSRLLRELRAREVEMFVPRAPADLERLPLLDLAAGYIQRALPDFPSSGASGPWRLAMDYYADRRTLRDGPVLDDALVLSPRRTTDRAEVGAVQGVS